MKVLAIDSGFERTGWAVIETDAKSKIEYLASGLIQTSTKKTLVKRIEEVYDSLFRNIKLWHPNVIVIEQIFLFKNQKTIIPVAQAQGACLLLAAQHDIALEFLTPLQIKQIVTGYGHSDKESIKKMIGLTLPKLDLNGKIDDEIDAIACGLAYCYLNKNLL